MKTKVLILMMILFGVSLNVQAQKKSKRTDTIEIKTSAWNETCREIVMEVLAYEKGVVSFEFVENTKTVRCTYKSGTTTPVKIREAISNAGFDADDIKANPRAYKRLPGKCKTSCCG